MEGTEPVIGEVVELAYDTLVILPEGNGSASTFYREDYRKIEVSQGKKSNIGKGAWIGAVGGVVAGAVVGALADCGTWEQGACVGEGALYGAVGGAILGVGAGALIKTERWVEGEMPAPAPVALSVGKDGSVRLAFSLRL